MDNLNLTDNQNKLAAIVNEVMKEDSSAADSPEKLLDRVTRKFLSHKLDMFPIWCTQMWMDNQNRLKRLREIGVRGKYDYSLNQETYWSNDRSFMSAEDIPQDMYIFMQTFVFRGFWGDEKVWRPFVRAICKRKGPMTQQEAENLLIKVKQLYGSNADLSLTR